MTGPTFPGCFFTDNFFSLSDIEKSACHLRKDLGHLFPRLLSLPASREELRGP